MFSVFMSVINVSNDGAKEELLNPNWKRIGNSDSCNLTIEVKLTGQSYRSLMVASQQMD